MDQNTMYPQSNAPLQQASLRQQQQYDLQNPQHQLDFQQQPSTSRSQFAQSAINPSLQGPSNPDAFQRDAYGNLKYAQTFVHGGQAVEQSVEADPNQEGDSQAPERPSEPHFDDQASRYAQAEVPSDRSAPLVSATGGNQDLHQDTRNYNQIFVGQRPDSMQQRIDTGNFNFPQGSSELRGESRLAQDSAQKINSHQYNLRQDRNNTLYAPPTPDMHIEGYGGAALPYPGVDNLRNRSNRALSGGAPVLRAYDSRNQSMSDAKSNRSGSQGGGVTSPQSKRSGHSRRSGMTRNPLHFEDKQLQHVGPGIDDRISHLYREYDNRGRVSQSFYQRAALAGIRNLETTSFRRDSPVRQTQSRFPEKYINTMRKSDTNYSSRRGSAGHKNDATLKSHNESFNLASHMLRNIEDTQPLRHKLSPGREFNGSDADDYKEMSASEQQLILEAAFTAVCDNIMSSQMHGNTDSWLQLSIDDKLLQFASFLSHMRKDYRLGAIVGVYILFKNHSQNVEENNQLRLSQGSPHGGVLGNYDPQRPEVGVYQEDGGTIGSIGQEITKVIIEEVFASLTEFKNQDPLLIKCELEVIGLFGIHQDLRQSGRLQILKNLLQDQNAIIKHNLIPNVLATMVQIGFEGLRELLDIAERDINGLQDQIVSLLIQMRIMQRLVIVPSILAQINQSYDPLVKQESLAMLNRLGTLVWESGGLPLIIELLDQGMVDRQLLASVLRTSGGEGEQLLIKLMKFHQNDKVRASAAAVLAYRLPADQLKMQVTIELSQDQYEIFDHTKSLRPGQMCTYRNGKISSLVLESLKHPNIHQDEDTPLSNVDNSTFYRGSDNTRSISASNYPSYPSESQLPRVEVHARDFLASLSRVMQMNEQYFRRMFENDDYSKQSMMRRLRINVLGDFNSMNVQCLLPRIDQNLAHTPSITVMDVDTANNTYDTGNIQDTKEAGGGDRRVAISSEIIRALCHQLLKEEKTKVREIIASAIGQIGKPEAHINLCVDALVKATANLRKSEESTLKSTIIWALGRLTSQETGLKAKKILIDGLMSPHWRVRAAACTSIANFGGMMADSCLPILMKLLRDGQQNKQIVAETIIALGPRGETEMISLLRKNEAQNRILHNNKSKECIVKSLALANIEHPNIDFIIETLFYTYSQDQSASIRKASLIALDILHKKSEKLQHEQTVMQTQMFNLTADAQREEANQSMNSQKNSFYYGNPNETHRSQSSTGTNRRRSQLANKKPHFNTYLQPKNLLPFFYKCLSDRHPQVRECAILCIKNFGAHGELLFIEGVSKESNPLVRSECARGLGSIGAQTFRSLLLALHDETQVVKDAASQAILSNMTIFQLRQQFEESEHQRQTICCTIKELMANNNPNARSFLRQDIISFLDNVLELFENMNSLGAIRVAQDTNQINIYNGHDSRSRSRDRMRSPPSDTAQSHQMQSKGPLEMFQAAHQDIKPLPPKKRPQSSSTFSKRNSKHPQNYPNQQVSKFEQATQSNNNKMYESSADKFGPTAKQPDEQYTNPSLFIHQIKQEAVKDQRHIPLRMQNQGYMNSTRQQKQRYNAGRRASTSRPMPAGPQSYPAGFQYSLSTNYSKVNNPISKLNSVKSQEAAQAHQQQQHMQSQRVQSNTVPDMLNPQFLGV